MIRALAPVAVLAIVAVAAPRVARANECNLYSPQTFGTQLRVGCPVTVIAVDSVPIPVLTFTRNGQPVMTSVAEDKLTLDVAFYHYEPGTCELFESVEQRMFNRDVISLPDLQPGERVALNGVEMTVLAAGTCDPVEPFFGCADPVQECPMGSDSPNPNEPNDDVGGCNAGGGSPSLVILALAGLALSGCRRRP